MNNSFCTAINHGRRIFAALSLCLLAALSACGGGGSKSASTEDDDPSSYSVNSGQSTIQNVWVAEGFNLEAALHPAPSNKQQTTNNAAITAASFSAASSSTEFSSATAPAYVIQASRQNLTLDQFSAEVRDYMTARESQSKQLLQWYASYSANSQSGLRQATVTVIGVGQGKATPSTYVANMPVKTYRTVSSDELSPEMHKKAVCMGRDTQVSEEYYDLREAYDTATEAMALGMPTSSDRKTVYERLDQVKEAEAKLPPAQEEQLVAARTAIRDQRDTALRNCAGVTY